MEWTAIVGILCTILGIVISYAVLSRNKSKDDKSDGRQDGVVLTELGYIKANTDEIKSEQKEQRKINTELYTELAAVKASAKQAHKRLDRMEGREEHTHETT